MWALAVAYSGKPVCVAAAHDISRMCRTATLKATLSDEATHSIEMNHLVWTVKQCQGGFCQSWVPSQSQNLYPAPHSPPVQYLVFCIFKQPGSSNLQGFQLFSKLGSASFRHALVDATSRLASWFYELGTRHDIGHSRQLSEHKVQVALELWW